MLDNSQLDKNVENLLSTIKNKTDADINEMNRHSTLSAALGKYKEFFHNWLSNGKLNLYYRNKQFNDRFSLNMILYGAPGTGKTYKTIDYAVAIIDGGDPNNMESDDNGGRPHLMDRYRELCKNGQIAFTTFHQSYTYEDFIEGLKPDIGNNQLKFRWQAGIFKKIADQASNDKSHNYVIIIDEINRANMSRVLGELITLLEPDKREGNPNALSVILPSGKKFSVPNNLYVIGTMNTADKSISNIDVALRRRFNFIEMPVNLEIIPNIESRDDILDAINYKLNDMLKSTDLLIGQAYFMDKNKSLVDILNQSVIPLLYEYFDDNRDKVEEVIKTIEKFGLSIDNDGNNYRRIKVKISSIANKPEENKE